MRRPGGISWNVIPEQYLDTPIETTLSSRLELPVPREAIVEIGNFGARDGASARIMYAALCLLLNQYHYGWIVFTGTKKIRNTFYRLNLHPIQLMSADLADWAMRPGMG